MGALDANFLTQFTVSAYSHPTPQTHQLIVTNETATLPTDATDTTVPTATLPTDATDTTVPTSAGFIIAAYSFMDMATVLIAVTVFLV